MARKPIVKENSHSGAVQKANWRENDQMTDFSERGKFFVECEWGVVGKYPGADKITRGNFNERQKK